MDAVAAAVRVAGHSRTAARPHGTQPIHHDAGTLRLAARRSRAAARLCGCALFLSCGPSATREPGSAAAGIALDTVARGLAAPLHVISPPGDAHRVFVVEQAGRVRLIKDGLLLARPYLDIRDRVGSGGERGLLSLAFHPRFAENGRLFVDYTDRDGHTRVARFTAGATADTVSPATERLVLLVRQPYANHNGGHVLFGRDGMLYVGMGDGGAGGDPHNNAQDLGSLLGKILRLDVDGDTGYAVPTDNPFAGTAARPRTRTGRRPEIWAYGLRNPWRMAFDTLTRMLLVADVGQGKWEEINAVADTARGVDYGWRHMEGGHCFLPPAACAKRGLLPAHEYGHDIGCSITGGVVYRGRALPWLAGHYLYSDWCGGWLRSFRLENGRATDHRVWDVRAGPVTSFGEDAAGEVYIVNGEGTVFRIRAARRLGG